jgi:hypothetical protein
MGSRSRGLRVKRKIEANERDKITKGKPMKRN